MTDANETANEGWAGEPEAPAVTYPEQPALPEARISLCLTPNKAPQLTARAQTPTEMKELLGELDASGVFADIGRIHSELATVGLIGAQTGATQVSSTPNQPAPQGATPPPFGPNVSAPQAPGYQGPPQGGAPAPMGGGGGGWQGQPQGGQGANSRGPKPRPDWPSVYKVNVPFNQKDAFKQYRNDNKDYFKGKVFWAGGGDYWVHGDVAQAFANFNPVAA